MRHILKSISILRGVHHVCIYQQGKEPVSNFPDHLNQSMALSYELIDQIFSAIKAINKSHDEIYFSIDDKFLVAYLMNKDCIALLLTDKKINFPLLNMGIKSAKMKIRRLFKEEQQQKIAAVTPPKQVAQSPMVDKELQVLLNQLSNVLKQYLGPATIFIFETDVEKWKKTYVQRRDNLPYLIDMLKRNLDPDTEQQQFVQQAYTIIGNV